MRSLGLLSVAVAATVLAREAGAFVHPAPAPVVHHASSATATTMMAAVASKGSSSGGGRLVPTTPSPPSKAGLGQRFFLGNFLPPYGLRETVRTQVSEDIVLFEQAQTFVNVSVNIRSTVIRMK